ncbi:Nce102p KNAG_0A07950 [Huiozyma naganishii CBS 8797]|uniref:MARVEL domain-containing protein n=1 Tax=Huiozyma naganishii (strain ATCC MYA-139 / BCRC 22969 / CBS 8797 / KCTC 17520 / NBRC 10181 / NCYC 3082 / Yp74L-3) TaxID=1071383 RepID=J7RFY0_HUIN7|nr:hypothetical protein KNAG_0A07950 [Kazachstania naganishii CBS 8797]CCK68448.1 hypothetical protein KNAG_0A07950 [Kazachstania naganishii CBS 8797]
MLALADIFLRLVNFVFLVICMGLISALLNTQHGHSSRINYCMFTAAYGITTDSFYGVVANFWEPLSWPLLLGALDFLNFVFTLTAGCVLAVGIRAHSCKNVAYRNKNKIVQGSENRCRQAQAAVAFFFFSMAIFLAKFIMSLVNIFTNGPFGSAGSSPMGSRFSKRKRTQGVPQGVPNISTV